MDGEQSLRRSGSMRDRDSIWGSREQFVPQFRRSQSQRLPQEESPLLRWYLEANIGEAEERLIILRLSKPMFAPKGSEDLKAKVTGSLELNKLHRDYNMLHIEVRWDISFSGYLELLGLKGGPHGLCHSGGSWSGNELQHKIGKMQVPSFNGKR